jgi:hypothetical protein
MENPTNEFLTTGSIVAMSEVVLGILQLVTAVFPVTRLGRLGNLPCTYTADLSRPTRHRHRHLPS